jgi:hypothetical protein
VFPIPVNNPHDLLNILKFYMATTSLSALKNQKTPYKRVKTETHRIPWSNKYQNLIVIQNIIYIITASII